jgi:Ca2+-binding EF-hand superfamily protein
MTIIKNICATSILCLLFLINTAQAAGNMGGGRGPMSFSDFDKNNDGMISREEFTATQRERVEKKAQTQSQTRTQTKEMNETPATPPMAAPTAGMGMQNQEQMQNQNQNQEQMQQRMRPANMPAFADYDLDGDSKVTQKEFYTARNNRIRARVLEGKKMRNMSNAPSFSSIDSNGDQQLSEEEFNMHQDQHMKMWEE